MYATVRTYASAAGLAEELAGRADEVRRIISEVEGFRAYYLIRTAEGVVSVSVYDSEAGAEESTTVAAAYIQENLPAYAGATPQVASGEVIVNA